MVPSGRSVYGRKRNHCVIFPDTLGTTADALERTQHGWFVLTNAYAASDLTVTVGESSFHLHKLPMVSRSGYLNRLVSLRRNHEGEARSTLNIHIDSLPGGEQIFRLIVKFCYGLAVDLTAVNVAPLYSAACYLEMTEYFEHGNLISKAEAFISFILFSSWKDTVRMLRSCEDISPVAQELGLVKQCSGSIAWKCSLDPQTISRSIDELCPNVVTNNSKNIVEESWWFEDVSVLRIDHFAEVISGIKAKGMKPRLVGGCIVYWTSKWLRNSKLRNDCDHKEVQRDTFERLIRVLPKENNAICCNFLLHLLKVGLVLNIDRELTLDLERRLAMLLESHTAGDLVVKNHKGSDTAYDVSLVTRVVEAYVTYFSEDPKSRMDFVAKVVDDYLVLVARDNNLSVEKCRLLAEALPANARHCHDKFYRAIDMYLKAHPTLTEGERRYVCRAMEYHKLSAEARNHTMKNDRLPLSITIRWILWEQVNTTKTLKTQETVGATKFVDKRWIKPLKKLETMKAEVEKMKVQLSNLQVCSLQLQRQVKLGLK